MIWPHLPAIATEQRNRYLTNANTHHMSTINIGTHHLMDAGGGAHLSPRMRVALTSSPTWGGHQGTKPRPGRQVAMMSDIFWKFLLKSKVLDSRWGVLKLFDTHPTPFIFFPRTDLTDLTDLLENRGKPI